MKQHAILTLEKGSLKIEGTTKEILEIVESLQLKGIILQSLKLEKK
jgi:hypothetical protein